jgi:hypothetical protein
VTKAIEHDEEVVPGSCVHGAEPSAARERVGGADATNA